MQNYPDGFWISACIGGVCLSIVAIVYLNVTTPIPMCESSDAAIAAEAGAACLTSKLEYASPAKCSAYAQELACTKRSLNKR